MASHKTIGIELGATSIHIAICEVDDQKVVVERIFARDLPEDQAAQSAALSSISDEVFSFVQSSRVAVGLVTDSTDTLSTSIKLTFNDPHVIENVLPQTMSDTWKITEDSQLAFEVRQLVKASLEDEMDGYNVMVISASRAKLISQISLLKPYRLEPHIIVPELQALPYTVKSLFSFPNGSPSAILDIGSNKACLAIVDDGKIVMSRAFKLGSNRMTQAIAMTFEIPINKAEQLKLDYGFLSLPGQERATFERFVRSGKLQDPGTDIDIVKLANACNQGMSMLFSGVNQTLMSFGATMRKEIKTIYLTGGGAKIAGIEDWFSQYMGVRTTRELPFAAGVINNGRRDFSIDNNFSIDAIGAAIIAADNANTPNTLNLRHGDLAHKGSLEFIKDNIWLIASIVVILIITVVFMMVSRVKMINAEHDQLKLALERATESTFGKKMTSLKQIKAEVEASNGYTFIPSVTAFSHFEWLSNEITNNMTDVDMEFSKLDIDTQRKIVTFVGEVGGDDGLPRFLQLLEQYECFPNKIQEPKTSRIKERTSFTLRVDANHCGSEAEVNE